MLRSVAISALLAVSLGLCACSDSNDGTLAVAFIDDEANLFADGIRLSQGGQHVRAAIKSGLVALDQNGDVVPALADRWNVTAEGSIFVFRLRDGTWPDGRELTSESVRTALQQAIRDLRGTSLGIDLSPIDDVRAMAGRVIEIRLASPLPDLLQLLAQPELALTRGEGDTGNMLLEREEGAALLSMKPPPERGLPEEEGWQRYTRSIGLQALDAQAAVSVFDEGEVDVVLGGRLASLPLADTGPLSRGTVRLDPAIGLFGLHVLRDRGILARSGTREALAMAIDRSELAAIFNVGGWVPTTRVVAPGLSEDAGLVGERWADLGIDGRRSLAASRIAAWRSSDGGDDPALGLTLSMSIGNEPGHALLFDELSRQWASIGVALVRAGEGEAADLALVDRVARYGSPIWFLNQFNCLLERGICSEEADVLAAQVLDEVEPAIRARLIGEAEAALTNENVYIPFGSPLRWSLVRGGVEGFSGNRWGFHPLSEFAVIPR